MPKSKTKYRCRSCQKIFSLSVLARHIKSKHEEILVEAQKKYVEFSADTKKCAICEIGLPVEEKLLNYCVVMVGANLDDKEKKGLCDVFRFRKTCSLKCGREFAGKFIWNRGLTKETDERVRLDSVSKMGKNNPIYRVLEDENRKEKWLKNVRTALANSVWLKSRKGKSLEEIHGEEKAARIKKTQSKSYYTAAAKRGRFPHEGMKHSPETCEKLREYRAKGYETLKKSKITKNQLKLYNLLKETHLECELEHEEYVYHIDIAFPDDKIAIEIDGDFFHVNTKKGFTVKYDVQKRNLINDKRKTSFLENRGWSVLRFWDSDVKEDIGKVHDKIIEVINGRRNY